MVDVVVECGQDSFVDYLSFSMADGACFCVAIQTSEAAAGTRRHVQFQSIIQSLLGSQRQRTDRSSCLQLGSIQRRPASCQCLHRQLAPTTAAVASQPGHQRRQGRALSLTTPFNVARARGCI